MRSAAMPRFSSKIPGFILFPILSTWSQNGDLQRFALESATVSIFKPPLTLHFLALLDRPSISANEMICADIALLAGEHPGLPHVDIDGLVQIGWGQ